MRIPLSLLASTYYYSWPSHAFILSIVGLACEEPSKACLARIGREVYEQFKAFRVLDGQLAAVPRSKGISCTKNPSERRCGRIRFNEIIEDLPAVLAMLGRMEVYCGAGVGECQHHKTARNSARKSRTDTNFGMATTL